mgnify:FL=1
MNEHKNELFVGRLGIDPVLKYTPKQKPVCELSIAINSRTTQKTTWKKVIVWGKQAELCNLYLKKGKQVFVQGRRQLREFMTSDGEKRRCEEVIASLIGFSNL